jgi:hypothetical protein
MSKVIMGVEGAPILDCGVWPVVPSGRINKPTYVENRSMSGGGFLGYYN